MTLDSLTPAPRPGTWQRLRPLPEPRSHIPPVVHGGRIYVFGGGGHAFSSQNSVWAYDPAEDRWERCADMPTRRSGTVALKADGRIHVMGGGFKQPNGKFRFLTTVEVYDPEADRWERGPELLQPHDYPAAAHYRGRFYVLGGHHPDATEGGPKTDPGFDFCERLDPAGGAWERIAPLGQPRFALAAAVLQGRLLTFGGVAFRPEGFDNFDLVEVYDPEADRWERHPELRLPWPAAGLGACVADERLYVFGGYSTDDIHPRCACYDPATGRWERLPDMPAPRAAMGVAVLDGVIYLVGGWADDGRTPQDSLFAYRLPRG